MRIKASIASVALGLSMVGCTSSVETPTTYTFEGKTSYKLNAADVFRVSRTLKQRQIVKLLKPIYGEYFYSETEFRAALQKQLAASFSDETYKALMEKSLVQAKPLTLSLLSDSVVVIRFGDESAPERQQLLDFSSLNKPIVTQHSANQLSTSKLTMNVDQNTLCVSLNDIEGEQINVICPTDSTGFALSTTHAYSYSGLGQEFQQAGNMDGRWNGRTRHAGNKMEGFNGGATGNTLIPLLYAANAKQTDFALYLNNLYSSEWTFDNNDLAVKASKGASEIIVMTADQQSTLRKQFMRFAGTPLVPPRKMFGMWLSEYGFDNWQEMDDKLKTLDQADFPIDGVVMDLQWFGNVKGNDPLSQMGTLTWDRENFPQPERKIAQLNEQGIGMVLIEESYVSQGLDEFKQLESKGYLAKDPDTGLGANVNPHGGGNWWGKGGMIDWSNPEVNQYWHNWKRQPLVDMGVIGHWTDLGEPEMYNHQAVYFNDQAHDEIHNLFNYYWLQGIYQGYQANQVAARPFMMSRSGTTGIQKFGGSMWSADIGSNLTSLAVHIGQQTNMMLSGIDYYGSDIGGFHRKGLGVIGAEKEPVLNETYTQWFAYSSLFDVPVRPHTENLCNCKETAPDRVGDQASNRENLALRYELIPYLYSLAHLAHQNGEPVYPSLSYVYSEDSAAADRVNQKMIGQQLMSPVNAKLGAKSVEAYLPEGVWFDYRSGKQLERNANSMLEMPLYGEDGHYQLPLFAVNGAIIPVAQETAQGWTSRVPDDISVKIFGLTDNQFSLFEDDGKTDAYTRGELAKTVLSVETSTNSALLSIKRNGQYQGMKVERALNIEWLLPENVEIQQVNSDTKHQLVWKQEGHVLHIELSELMRDKTTIELLY
ncbi:glycoside hydrolase family 31 [Vibrio sinaloensis DSM 21326]|uniref:Glycoside hydrolase family 31 n=1 Tax=Vibrio sinaloensis DSM 21326 TaxID=945550 RepID=E8M5C4_PHOS4|nr:TIM-barrel domain-containing protein [Vibrio sinaloensis]EGA70717.1 glycoside hydrolase family 31 [Vibrio sinaloensis DSM 21326]